jgi:hypothetical protein
MKHNRETRNKEILTLEDTTGTSTGEKERAVELGGWAGTDDANSTAPSDLMGDPAMPEEEKPYAMISHDIEESIQQDEERQEEDFQAFTD